MKKKVDKKVLSFFVLAFPVMLIVAIGMLAPALWWASVGLALYHFLMLKQFLDKYHEFF